MKKLETVTAEQLQSAPYAPVPFLVEELLPEGLHILAGNRATGNDLSVHKAIGSVDGDVSVDQMPDIPQIVDERKRPACRNVYLDSPFLGLLNGTYSRNRYLMGLEADQCPVNVKK